MLNKALLVLIGFAIAFSGVNPSFAKEEKEKVPKGLKTKTEINYEFKKESGKYKKTLYAKSIYQYDIKGKETDRSVYNTDGKLASKILLKYDNNGNKIEWDLYDANDKLKSKDRYEYDNKGNCIQLAQYDGDAKLTWKALAKYDDKGNMIEFAVYAIKEESGKEQEILVSQTNWEYEFYPEEKK
ncbi:MAG: hypothetical protein HY811_02565 [Planctomycetes bacterium]|nr:hypothetical protein [Planctomycetota bacterium]